MNILVWNCRGTSHKGFANLIRELRNEYNTSFVSLMKTHTAVKMANNIIKRIRMEG